MERVLTPDEKIKRMEEIYYNRKMQTSNVKEATVNIESNKKYEKIKKLIIQVGICIILYVIFYLVKNYNYTFSATIMEKTQETLAYDTNFKELYLKIPTININQEDLGSIVNAEELDSENKIEETLSITDTKEEAIIEEDITEDSSSISEMSEDAKTVKESYNFIKPLEGTITSRFGTREKDSTIVSAYHTGIDIAQNLGTPFLAAISGVVKTVSTEGGYRKSYNNS